MAKDQLRFLGDPDGTTSCSCDILDKSLSVWNYVQYMFDRTNTMFKYQNLPDTIPEHMLEYMLQVYGSVAIIEDSGCLYAMRCHFGGAPDPYYRPTQAVVANPALGLSKTYKVVNHLPPFSKDTWDSMPPCVRFLNDTQIQGLLPLFSRYATQMTENDISIRSAQINLRAQTIIAADDGPEIQSANQFIKNLEEGKLTAISRRSFLDGIHVLDKGQGNNNTVIQLIELQQYLKASWYNEIGLNSNFNMKRQYMSADEVNSSADIMLPLVDNMFSSRQMAVEAINKEFGTNITVEKDSAWAKKQIQADMSTAINPETGEPIDINLVNKTEDQIEQTDLMEEEEQDSDSTDEEKTEEDIKDDEPEQQRGEKEDSEEEGGEDDDEQQKK